MLNQIKNGINYVMFTLIVTLTLTISVTAQTNNALPTLRGEKAINELKQNGQYDSLMDAVKAARKENGQTDEPQTDDAIGQNSNLTASDGATNDAFGVSVAISGNTAIIGASGDDVGVNTDQGSAYIFVRSGTGWIEQAKLTAADGAADDFFGISVALAGDTVIVGARLDDVGVNTDQGSAYIFIRSGTIWSQQAKLTAADGAAGDSFGISVAIAGETAIVGAWSDVVGANSSQGSAYIFIRSGTVWSQQAQLTASDGAIGDNFGFSVTISDDTAIIGAIGDDFGVSTNQGSAYIFTRSGTIWSQQTKITAADGATNDQFGSSVALSGDTIIVGAELDNSFQGSAYIFIRSGAVWTQQAQLTAADGVSSDRFGRGVSISGDTAIVGAWRDDVGANVDQGSAYVFTRSGTVWTQQIQLTASDGATSDFFGISVAIDGSTIFVGAFGNDVGANTDQGSAYTFRVLDNGWTQEARKVASDGAGGDQFGYSVAISGDTAIVGARFEDTDLTTDQGAAYIYVRNGTTWTEQAKLLASDAASSDQFGTSVAISGDTVIVGAFVEDTAPNTNQGAAYIFVRSGTNWTEQAKLLASDAASNDFFGGSVAISGNTAIVGSLFEDTAPNTNNGAAYIFVRSGVTWTQQAKLLASDATSNDELGFSVGISGNTAIVGARFEDTGANTNNGAAYIFVRSGVTWTQQAKLLASDAASSDQFSISVAISGDTVIVGADLEDTAPNTSNGAAYIFVRNGTSWTEQAKLLASDAASSDQFGWSVAISGDTAIVGAIIEDTAPNTNQGAAYVYVRSGTSWSQQTKLLASDAATGDELGSSVGISGDKIIVGAPLSDVATSSPFSGNADKENLVPQAADQGGAYFFVNGFAPTAANVSISGRVLTSSGAGLRNAVVTLTKQNGETISTRTSSFGYYRFDDIGVGQTVIISVVSKRFSFVPQVIGVNADLTEVDFIANGGNLKTEP